MNGTDPQQIHGYTYSNNSPITFSDSSGLFYTCDEEGNTCSSAPTTPYPQDESTSAWGGAPSGTGRGAGCYSGNRSPDCEKSPSNPSPAPTVKSTTDNGPTADEIRNEIIFNSIVCHAAGSMAMFGCGIKMVGVCAGGGVADVMGASGSYCIAVDSRGISGFATAGGSVGLNHGGFFGLGVIASTGNIDDQRGPFEFVEGGGGGPVAFDGSFTGGKINIINRCTPVCSWPA